MIDQLIRIGDLIITPFGVMTAIAFIAAYHQLARSLERTRAGSRDDASALVLAAALGGMVGAKIYYALLYGDPKLLLSRGGLVWYGGLLLGMGAVMATIGWRRLAPWATTDALVPAMALGYGIGRIGCFLVGDDYGVPTDLSWGVKFPVGLPPSTAGALRSVFRLELPAEIPDEELVAVHPTQIYEALAAFFIWRFGLRSLRNRSTPGGTTLSVTALLFAERFVVEFWRAKDDRFFGMLSLAQVISLLGLMVVCGLFLRRRGRAIPRSLATGSHGSGPRSEA